MRIRSIKPEFWTSESIGRLSRNARLLFIGLWSFAEDSGRGRGALPAISGALFPYDVDALSSIGAWMDELEREGMVIRYKADDGNSYYEIPKWLKHQRIEKPSKTRLPGFTNHSRNTPGIVGDISALEQGAGSREQGSELPPPPTPSSDRKMPEAAAVAESDEVLRQVEEVWSVWPKKIKALEAKREIAFAIRRDGVDAVLAGTKAIAAANAARNTVPVSKFMPDPVLFFQTARYHDDPAQYGDREVTLSPFQMTERIKVLDAEHRKHPGNPQSAAYDRATCTDAMRAEARMLADEIKKLKTSGSK